MYFIFLVVVVFSLSGCHNALLGLFNDWMNAINPKLPFVRQSNIIAYGWFDKGAAFNWVKHYGSIPLLWPLDGEVVHVHGLAHGKHSLLTFHWQRGTIFLWTFPWTRNMTLCRNHQRICSLLYRHHVIFMKCKTIYSFLSHR